MHYQKILDSLKCKIPRKHTPEFRIVPEGEKSWRVFDGVTDIAKLYPCFFDIWRFSPFEPEIKHNQNPPGEVVDIYTLHNTVINIGRHGWPERWRAQKDPIKWFWHKSSGDVLEAEIRLDAADGEFCSWLMKIFYEPDESRYRFTWKISAKKLDNIKFEPFNLMAVGALACRVENRRWDYSVWEDVNNVPRRIVHSNALFFCTDYGDHGPRGAQLRTRSLSYPQGYVGYAAHKTFNPFILIHKTNLPLEVSTCCALFDEHIIFKEAMQENLGDDTYFHYDLDIELVNVPVKCAAEITEKSEDPAKPRKWHFERTAIPFHMDIVNDLEKPAEAWEPEDAPLFCCLGGENQLAWSTERSFSGSHSLLIKSTGERASAFPEGAACQVEPHCDYSFSAMVCTSGAAAAKLELFGFRYQCDNVTVFAASDAISSDNWRKIEVTLNSANEAYLMPRLVAEGKGRVWFDNIQLKKRE